MTQWHYKTKNNTRGSKNSEVHDTIWLSDADPASRGEFSINRWRHMNTSLDTTVNWQMRAGRASLAKVGRMLQYVRVCSNLKFAKWLKLHKALGWI